jgi:LysM repeat protein
MSKTGRVVWAIVGAVVLVVLTVIVTKALQKDPTPLPNPQPGPAPTQTMAAALTSTNAAPTAPAPAGTAAVLTGSDGYSGRMGSMSLSKSGAGDALALEGLSMAQAGQLVPAQAKLSEAVVAGVGTDKVKAVREAIGSLADQVQFSSKCLKEDTSSKMYQVVSGDNLTNISNKFLVPFELIQKMNRLSSTGITAGQSLKVLQGPVSLEIVKSRFELSVWVDKACVRVYPVAIGAENKTPEGMFVVGKNKMRNPPYQPQSKSKSAFKAAGAPDNPLGTRWIAISGEGLGNGYGIHGTIDPSSIGRDVSEGCIRLNNKDVEELFDMVVPQATKVTIRP